MILPDEVEFIIDRLNKNGHRADVVGGPVRDFLLGNEPHDYDITTDALPERVMEIFSDKRTVPTGIKHGTVSLILNKNSYEITTYRIDGEYKDSRHPESVSFTDKLADDLKRRDFTMNAIAYNHADGITDLYGGREDIERKIIRAVGDPYERFSEDALRILRAIRFSSCLGFGIDPLTREAILAKKELLKNVSVERIYDEFSKMLAGRYAYTVFDSYREVIAVFLPEISSAPLPDKNLFDDGDYGSRLFSLFYLSEKTSDELCAASVRLHTDRRLRELGTSVLSAVGRYFADTEADIGFMLASLGEEVSKSLVSLEILLGRKDAAALDMLSEYLESGLPYRVSDLKVNGSDLAPLGYCGREIGAALASLLDDVIFGRVPNEREALLSELCNRKAK